MIKGFYKTLSTGDQENFIVLIDELASDCSSDDLSEVEGELEKAKIVLSKKEEEVGVVKRLIDDIDYFVTKARDFVSKSNSTEVELFISVLGNYKMNLLEHIGKQRIDNLQRKVEELKGKKSELFQRRRFSEFVLGILNGR